MRRVSYTAYLVGNGNYSYMLLGTSYFLKLSDARGAAFHPGFETSPSHTEYCRSHTSSAEAAPGPVISAPKHYEKTILPVVICFYVPGCHGPERRHWHYLTWVNLTNGYPLNSQGIAVSNGYGFTSTLAGSGATGAADGMGTGASFNLPFGVAVDPFGNI
jgi:hypothetical protein